MLAGITQKYLVVTCNYPARAAGVGKLMSTKEALKKCPSIVLISGEDLSPYRCRLRRNFSCDLLAHPVSCSEGRHDAMHSEPVWKMSAAQAPPSLMQALMVAGSLSTGSVKLRGCCAR